MYILTSNNNKNNHLTLIFQLAIAFIFVSGIVLLISSLEITARYYILIIAVPICLFIILNYKLTFSILIISMFINLNFFYFSISELLVPFVFLSFLFTYRFKFEELKNPLIFPFAIFLLSVVPSFVNSGALLYSVLLSYHLVAFFLIFTFSNFHFTHYDKIKNFVNIYIFGALLNAFHVIFLAVTTGKRVFGLSGIVYVDLVSVALIICLIGFLYNKGKRLVYGIAMTVLLTALIFTQTRSIWIVCGLIMAGILIQSYFNTDKSSISKSKIILIIIFVVVSFVSMIFILQEVNPGTFERIAVKSQTERPINEAELSSLATRVFIWETAWNAFLSHPFIGIGIYSFPFTSAEYSNINPLLYKLYVQNLSAHTTILALLAEVGLLGFFGFIFFLHKTISLARINLKRSISKEQWYYSLMIFWISIYIIFSMIVTDAWLWSTLLMVWAIILSISIANYRLILKNGLRE